MAETNGAAAPNDGALSDEAIDAAIPSEQEAPIPGDETHKLAAKLSELEQQLRAKDEVIARRDRDYQDLTKTAKQQSEMLSELVGGMKEAKDRGYWFERDRLEAIQRKAAGEADVATYDAASQQLRALDYNRAMADQKGRQPTAADPKTADPPKPEFTPPEPAILAWIADNPWFNADPELHDFAVLRDARLQAATPDTAKRLAKVREDVVKRFPEKFPSEMRAQASAVSRPGPQGGQKPKPKAKTLADLPEDAKLALARIKGRDPKFKDEDYLSAYQWDK